MRISIRPDLAQFVDEKVRTGHYADADAVVNDAVEMLKEQEAAEAMSQEEIEELRREVDIGLQEIERGEIVEFTGEDIKREGRAALERRRKAQG